MTVVIVGMNFLNNMLNDMSMIICKCAECHVSDTGNAGDIPQ